MLQPENRIEQLFTEGNTTVAIDSNKIEISEINFKGIVNEFQENSVQIPPISLRAEYFYKLLSVIEKKDMGALRREKERLMGMAIGFKMHSIDNARGISRLVEPLDRLEQEAYLDERLSKNCRRHKPQVFHEVKWLLKLKALTSIKYLELEEVEKEKMIELLGFGGKLSEIDDYRLKCLEKGSGRNLKQLYEAVNFVKNLNITQFRYLNISTGMINRMKNRFKPSVYWASCFTVDHPEFKDLFESKEWNISVRKYIIK
jgi:hypothetical protein